MARPGRSVRVDVAPGLVPPGDYQAEVVESAVLPTASGRGETLKLVFEIGAGDFRGRRVTEWLNIVNDHATAQRIAQEMLARLCAAAGLAGIADSDELHRIPVMIRVDIRPGSDGYGDRNTIKDYRPLDASRLKQAASVRRPWDP
ncbi:hypothetical protein CXZ10_15385 [Pleomorphomonas diazotrophica]|uniref:DUF669 domain-containing protein n=1 Tax=Pleomorphomonas diazotrophica TaxID=1166257 RepID=A0A1I4UKR6_9HYPH|nr:DUF669 domain-containing protein [Pleomorphomonas diazotrophica]PKR88398.1 hypothetical protein CXZ10_15385 [Pleomorphomonas diazotrophica]SFM89293.1 Protein of unknown function [Pleomorphomonas diazotrophica]